jgi:hypothetical protein
MEFHAQCRNYFSRDGKCGPMAGGNSQAILGIEMRIAVELRKPKYGDTKDSFELA